MVPSWNGGGRKRKTDSMHRHAFPPLPSGRVCRKYLFQCASPAILRNGLDSPRAKIGLGRSIPTEDFHPIPWSRATMDTQYETRLIPKAILQQKLHEWSLMLEAPGSQEETET
jgi:hypothetical protein